MSETEEEELVEDIEDPPGLAFVDGDVAEDIAGFTLTVTRFVTLVGMNIFHLPRRVQEL